MAVALVFPGQGSQRPGMGAPWRSTPGWSLVEEAGQLLGRDLAALLTDADAEQLRATREAQLSTLLVSLLVLRALPPGLPVAVVAGHSLGELTALCAAGVLSEPDAVHLVAERGEAMGTAAAQRPGTMAAVLGLEHEAVVRTCEELEDVWPANDNAPQHVVVSGTVDGVAAARDRLKQAGARRVLPLPVGGAFHTPLMASARPRLEAALSAVRYGEPHLPVLCNVTARPHDAQVPQLLSAQLTAPVRWREQLEQLRSYDVDTVVEVGAGGVLTGLTRRTLPEVRAVSVATPEDVEQL